MERKSTKEILEKYSRKLESSISSSEDKNFSKEYEKFKIAFSSDPKHNPQPLMDVLEGIARYDIRVHMVYAIISVHHPSLEDVAGMQPFEFVKEYEACMAEKKLRPLFSATSGKGILDYKRVVAELTALWRRYNLDTK